MGVSGVQNSSFCTSVDEEPDIAAASAKSHSDSKARCATAND